MSNYEYDLPQTGDVWDAYERGSEAEFELHLDAKQERAFDRGEWRGPDWRPEKRVKRADANRDRGQTLAWRTAVLDRADGCVAHANPADCSDRFHAHHVLPQQLLRIKHPAQVWNPLVGACLCDGAHDQFHRGRLVIVREMLPLDVWMHCTMLEPLYMGKHYPARSEAA